MTEVRPDGSRQSNSAGPVTGLAAPQVVGSDAGLTPVDDVTARKLERTRRRADVERRPGRPAAENVVQLALPPMPEPDPVKLRSRNRWLGISALVCIALPVLLASLYYAFFAADQYATEARFAVRSNDSQAADVIGVFSGMPSSTVISDSYILTDYVRSIEMVRALEARIPLREIYSRSQADFFVRLDPTISIEKLVEYWQSRVKPVYDSTKNTISIEATAFMPQDAQTVLTAILDVSKNLVNNLSQQARQDAVKFAASEVIRAEQRVRDVNNQMLAFRTAHNEVDPTVTATSTLGIASGLDSERSRLKSQLAAISGYLAPDAPSVQMLRSRIEALDKESASVQDRVSSDDPASSKPGSSGALANVVGEYQDVLLSQQFAEKAYEAAQASLERARVEADRQQSYLAVYVAPTVPQDAIYPRAMLNTLAIMLLAGLAWGLGALMFLTVRDHVA